MKKKKKIVSLLLATVMGVLMILQTTTSFASSDTISVGLSVGASCSYGSYSTRYYTDTTNNNSFAYCVQPSKNSPASGTYTGSASNISGLRAILYYGYGGPGFDDPNYGAKKIFGFSDSEISAKRLPYAYTHTLTALAYYGGNWDSMGSSIEQGMVDLKSAFLDIYNFYVSADSTVPGGFTAYLFNTGSTQIMATWRYTPTGKLTLTKVSANPTLTDGNSCYSLAGAEFGVYTDSGCTNQIATLTTDSAGNANIIELDDGMTVYIKEKVAPKGFALSSKVETVTITSGQTATVTFADKPQADPVGVLLGKIDKETNSNKPQGSASLAGAEFTVKYYDGFYDTDPSKQGKSAVRTWIIRTDENGIVLLSEKYKVSGNDFFYVEGNSNPILPLGTITIQESKSPTGYLLNSEIYVRQVTSDGSIEAVYTYNQPTIPEQIIRGGVKIAKRDYETKETVALGGASLGNAQFDIITLNENTVLVEGKEYSKGQVVKTIVTDPKTKIASTDADTLPPGHFKIVESITPEGYLMQGILSQEFDITEDGVIVDLTDVDHSIQDQVKRGDIRGVKISAGTHKRLANVPFKITSKTTGESHIVVTDENGEFSTSSDWVSHKQNTNAGTSSEDGVWFGTSEPDDSKGALIHDTYIVEELRCEANEGLTLIPPFEIVVSRNDYEINLGTLTDEYEKEVTIQTMAADKETGEKSVVAGKNVTIVDTVIIKGLEIGKEYQLKGWQMLKEENTKLLVNGEPVESDFSFLAIDSNMKVEVEFSFDASQLAGQSLVTFEELYDMSGDEPVKVAEHKDIEDEGQTVAIEERVITIHTTATDKETGEKSIVAGENVTIVDTVTLEGLEVGTEYQLKGWQMLKEENAELLIDGKRVENDFIFKATDSEMKVEVEFSFDASELAGQSLVTFEELYDMSDSDEPVKVAEHTDIEAEEQTVVIEEKPEEPIEPEEPVEPEEQSVQPKKPKTGDSSPILLLVAVAGTAFGIMFYVKKKDKKNQRNNKRNSER